MSQNLYNVVFRGMLTGAKSEDEVKVELAALFKASADKIEALFSGKPVVIKRNIDAATATKFRAAFERAGAFCELVKAEESAEQPDPGAGEASPAQRPEPSAQPEPAPAGAEPAPSEPASAAEPPDDGGSDVEEVTAAPPPSEPEPSSAPVTASSDGEAADSIARSGDPNGTVLERDVSANLSQLAIDESDRPHQPHEDVPPPQVDIDSLSLAEDDTPLSQRPREAPREFDTSGMRLEPPPERHSQETE